MLGLYDNMIEVFSDSARSMYIEAAILVLPSSKMEKKLSLMRIKERKRFIKASLQLVTLPKTHFWFRVCYWNQNPVKEKHKVSRCILSIPNSKIFRYLCRIDALPS